jgi:hypothetical protein
MKLLITNDENDIVVAKDFSDLDETKNGLMGQLLMELELIKDEILTLYSREEDDG